MKILNFGSMNYDYVYTLPHIVTPGETIASTNLEICCGGKGLNQSIAVGKAGAAQSIPLMGEVINVVRTK